MSNSLLAPTFLFRFAAPCRRQKSLWTDKGLQLPASATLPCFGDLEDRPSFAEVRAGWNATGIGFSFIISGKKQALWCRDSRIEDSDGVQLWIDTRDTHNIHRAGRFCHRFGFLPKGAGRTGDDPVTAMLAINRARESPKPMERNILQARAEKRMNGYLLECFIPAEALTGYDPNDQPKIGFSYAVVDRELGWQTFTLSNEFPITEDPSLWGTLDLVK